MKNKPHLLLIFLAVILAFILGVRYGQGVEKNNKTVDYLLSITPTHSSSPTPRPISPSPKEATATPTILLKMNK
jgi:hypothetical protein